MVRTAFLPLVLLLALPALPAAAQGGAQVGDAPAGPTGEFGCEVGRENPCRGRVDFERGRSYEFRIAGPGEAVFHNEGNRRCVLEYSLTESALATTGRRLEMAPGQSTTLPVKDATGMIVRFFNRGLGTPTCDLLVELRG
ncbi:hypothetical protein [Rhodocista pekingensis]|uniref:Uncharacterized protein n=1 Tax=Rhodocista pekingensis TaxID=201185 RepID=A0ABW2KYL5_9PROT